MAEAKARAETKPQASEWSEVQVWNWVRALPYASDLGDRKLWQTVNGPTLVSLNYDGLRALGIPGPVQPRLLNDIQEVGKPAATERDPATPEAEEQKVRVKVQIFVNSLGKIDSSTETFESDFWVRASYSDPHLAEAENPESDFRSDWEDLAWFNPRLEVVNSHQLDSITEQKFVDDGQIIIEHRYRGTLFTDMHLHLFPFDSQLLHIDVESTFFSEQQIELVSHSPSAPLYSMDIDHSEFDIDRAYVERKSNTLEWVEDDKAGGTFGRYSLIMEVSRKSGFYIRKVGLVYVLSVIIGIVPCFMNPDDIGNRLQITTTAFLTLVAFQFVIADSMPKIGYSTRLDITVDWCYFIMLASCILTVVQFNFIFQSRLEAPDIFVYDLYGFLAMMFILLGVMAWLGFHWQRSKRHRKNHAAELKNRSSNGGLKANNLALGDYVSLRD